MSTHSTIVLLEDRFAAVTRRNTHRLLPSRWKVPIYAFVLAFAIVVVMVVDPYSGAFADAKIERVELVGITGSLPWKREEKGLVIDLPATPPGEHAVAFRILGRGLV